MSELQKITLAVVGSRAACDYAAFEQKLKKRIERLELEGFVIDVIISGEAPGVDAMVVDFCKWNRYNYRPYPADWDGLGKGAGFIRNSEVVVTADVVVAFWDKVSHGTKDTVEKTLAARKTLYITSLPPLTEGQKPYYPQTRKLLKANEIGAATVRG